MKIPLRQSILKQRKALSNDQRLQLSALIIERLTSEGFIEGKKSVHLYYPINNEVNTLDLIEQLWAKGIAVIMPRTDVPGKKIDNFQISSFNQLEPTIFNLMEPKTSLPPYTEGCDLILVPGLVFDHRLNRIGYGGGFYDRFLANSLGLKVALAYDFQIQDAIPVEDHDVKMDMIVTDKSIYQ